MEGKKILDLSNLSDEHFDSVQKAVYRCMGSDEPGSFSFVTNSDTEALGVLLKKAFESTAMKGVFCGAVAVVGGYCIGKAVDKTIQYVRAKKREKELFEKL